MKVAEVLAALCEPRSTARADAARLIGATQLREALPALVAAMIDDEDGAVRDAARAALERFPADARLEPLLAVLRDPDANTYRVQTAGQALGRLDAAATAGLIAVLRDAREWIDARTYAAEALGHIGTAAAADALLAAWNGDAALADESHAALLDLAIVEAGGHIADPRFRDLLLGLAADPARSRSIRSEAVYALSGHGGTEVVALLRALLGDRDEVVRASAIVALGRCGDAAAVPALTRIRDTDDPDRDMAASAIQAIRARD